MPDRDDADRIISGEDAWQVLKGSQVITTIRGEGAEQLARAAGDGVPGYSMRRLGE